MNELSYNNIPYGELLRDYLSNRIDRGYCNYELSYILKNMGFDKPTDSYFFVGDENTRYIKKFRNSLSSKRIGIPKLSYVNLCFYYKLGLFVIVSSNRTSLLFSYHILKVIGVTLFSNSEDGLEVMQITKSPNSFSTSSCAMNQGLIHLTKLYEKWKKMNLKQK